MTQTTPEQREATAYEAGQRDAYNCEMVGSKTTKFDEAAGHFRAACIRAGNWRHNYFGAAYSSRIMQAIKEVEQSIRGVRNVIRIDENER